MSTLVLALNPSIDAEWRVEQIQWGEKNTVESERRWAGGKGVNVARWLRHLGARSRLLLPLGGMTGRELARQLHEEKISPEIVWLRQTTRVNVIVTPSAGRQLRLNPPGPKLVPDEWRAVFHRIQQALPALDLLVISGSLPREAPVTTYRRIIQQANRIRCRVLLDCEGASLASAVAARPFLVKPNEHELAQWHGRRLRSHTDVVRAGCAMSDATKGWVLVSRGGQGAVLLNAQEHFALHAEVPKINAVNTVGAGDALLAAVAAQMSRNTPPQDWLRWGVATGTAAAQCPAGTLAELNAIRRLTTRIALRSL